MQLIYQMDITGEFDYEKLSPVDENANVLNRKQAMSTLQAVRDHIGEIDEVIKSSLDPP